MYSQPEGLSTHLNAPATTVQRQCNDSASTVHRQSRTIVAMALYCRWLGGGIALSRSWPHNADMEEVAAAGHIWRSMRRQFAVWRDDSGHLPAWSVGIGVREMWVGFEQNLDFWLHLSHPGRVTWHGSGYVTTECTTCERAGNPGGRAVYIAVRMAAVRRGLARETRLQRIAARNMP